MLSELAIKRAEVARAAKAAKRDPHAVADLSRLRAEYAAARIVDFVERTVSAAPPLTQEQRERLAGLFSGGSDAA